jgi:gas vesicle protein
MWKGGGMSDNKKNTLWAFILGGLIGAIVGVLYAPKSGKETRQNIKKLGEEIADTVSDLTEDFTETGRKVYGEGKERVLSEKDKIGKAFEAAEKGFENSCKNN